MQWECHHFPMLFQSNRVKVSSLFTCVCLFSISVGYRVSTFTRQRESHARSLSLHLSSPYINVIPIKRMCEWILQKDSYKLRHTLIRFVFIYLATVWGLEWDIEKKFMLFRMKFHERFLLWTAEATAATSLIATTSFLFDTFVRQQWHKFVAAQQ